jgi:hypothetical protein
MDQYQLLKKRMFCPGNRRSGIRSGRWWGGVVHGVACGIAQFSTAMSLVAMHFTHRLRVISLLFLCFVLFLFSSFFFFFFATAVGGGEALMAPWVVQAAAVLFSHGRATESES